MTVRATPIPGLLIVEPSAFADERGAFTELYQNRALASCWNGTFVRSAISYNRQRGTLRGLHYQDAPHADAKLVTCIRGSIYDVVADVRPGSPTFGRWHAVELTADSGRSVFLSEGLAHGFETLSDDATVLYHLGAYFVAEASRGVRWDDPALSITWPLPPAVLSAQDQGWERLRA